MSLPEPIRTYFDGEPVTVVGPTAVRCGSVLLTDFVIIRHLDGRESIERADDLSDPRARSWR